jgi:hypothetical protein
MRQYTVLVYSVLGGSIARICGNISLSLVVQSVGFLCIYVLCSAKYIEFREVYNTRR